MPPPGLEPGPSRLQVRCAPINTTEASALHSTKAPYKLHATSPPALT